jgi:hypothetical protein
VSNRIMAERPALPSDNVIAFPTPRDVELDAMRSRIAELEARLVSLERNFSHVATGCPIAQRLVRDA